LTSLKDAKGVGERQAKAVAEEAQTGGNVIKKFRHGMVWVKNKAWRLVLLQAEACNGEGASKGIRRTMQSR
jgi:hypothetical protein